ncbi:MAG: PP0621 family protein [Pyrinomonadaceae bacterium]
MKYLVVIALLALLLVLLYRRLRPYLRTIRSLINAFRQFQTQAAKPKRQNETEKLVRCATCGVWIPITRALTPRSGEMLFCSAECLGGKAAPKKRSA